MCSDSEAKFKYVVIILFDKLQHILSNNNKEMNATLIQFKYEHPALSDAVLAVIITLHFALCLAPLLLVLFSRNLYVLIIAILLQIAVPLHWIILGHCFFTPIEKKMSQNGMNNGAVDFILIRMLNIMNVPNSQYLVNTFLILNPFFIISLALFKIYYYKLL